MIKMIIQHAGHTIDRILWGPWLLKDYVGEQIYDFAKSLSLKPDSTICIYYTGFGKDICGNGTFKGGVITPEQVIQALNPFQLNAIVISDSCYSGPFIRQFASIFDHRKIFQGFSANEGGAFYDKGGSRFTRDIYNILIKKEKIKEEKSFAGYCINRK